jgi:hypothetical protein
MYLTYIIYGLLFVSTYSNVIDENTVANIEANGKPYGVST